MCRLYKRVLSLLLCIMIIVMVPLQVLADTPGNSSAGKVPVPHPGGGGSGGSYKAAPVFAVTTA